MNKPPLRKIPKIQIDRLLDNEEEQQNPQIQDSEDHRQTLLICGDGGDAELTGR